VLRTHSGGAARTSLGGPLRRIIINIILSFTAFTCFFCFFFMVGFLVGT
jgi:hypothetical protein